MRTRIIIAAIVVALVGVAINRGGTTAAAQPVVPPRFCFGPNNPCLQAPVFTETLYPVWVNCTSTGQLCSPAFTLSLQLRGPYVIDFTTSPLHCSDIRLYVYLDGQLLTHRHPSGIGTQDATNYLGPGQSLLGAGQWIVGSAPRLDMTSTHQVSIQAEGRVGGCNTGTLSSWGGMLSVRTLTRP